jgi:hypothetical protein
VIKKLKNVVKSVSVSYQKIASKKFLELREVKINNCKKKNCFFWELWEYARNFGDFRCCVSNGKIKLKK